MPDAQFWHERWKKNEIPFHELKPNPLLVKHFKRLGLAKGARVFVPLCGKTLDIRWLRSKGYRVVAAELSEIAVKQLFAELKLNPAISKSKTDGVKRYFTDKVEVFVGDIFKVTRKMAGRVDAIYDRAALVALPKNVRVRYTDHMMRITNKAPQLLVTFDYDQAAMAGPPFAISNTELVEHYSQAYGLQLLASASIPGGLKGKCPATENLWLLK